MLMMFNRYLLKVLVLQSRGSPHGIAFNTDGTKMFFVGD